MTPEQAVFQLQKVAAEVQERDGSTYIFSSAGAVNQGAIVSVDLTRDQMGRLPAPSLVLKLGAEASDEEQPRISATTQIDAIMFVERISDPYGGEMIREFTRIQDLLLADVFNLTKMAGIRVTSCKKSGVSPAPVDARPLATRFLQFTAVFLGSLSAGDRLPPTIGLAIVDGGGQTADLTWTRPAYYANRYDYVGIVVRRKSGSAPTDVTDGTSVQAITDNAAVTDSPGAGTHFYSTFVGYSQDGTGTANEYSPATSDSVVVA